MTDTGEVDGFTEPSDDSAKRSVFASGGHAGDVFAGTARRAAKTSIATGAVEGYSTIAGLRSSLQGDAQMKALQINAGSDSVRVTEENRNVTVHGFIYAIHKESDNDFHLIVGDQGCHQGPCAMNCEVSGWPQSKQDPSYQTLVTVRATFKEHFGSVEPGTSSGYQKVNPPMPVTLTGSLFFDVDHNAIGPNGPVVGPTGYRPDSAWEIHPLTAITFEP